ncbi:hypothetical protein DY000_02015847 [Brassica cretica]|uniref:Uncharacterized protein n=1 Tax=Brassica cretica TaxID=69181 RepID=A0ABQ7CT09_BRACR|nr:hypothetical protein DY000_02015847 [Brassica cretica]
MSADDLNNQQTRYGNTADDNVENTLAGRVQLAERASWTLRSAQLTRSASWTVCSIQLAVFSELDCSFGFVIVSRESSASKLLSRVC